MGNRPRKNALMEIFFNRRSLPQNFSKTSFGRRRVLYQFGGERLPTSRLARTLAPPENQIDTIPDSVMT